MVHGAVTFLAVTPPEQKLLLAQVVAILPDRSLLPPPTIIRLRRCRHATGSGFEVAVATDGSPRSGRDGALCEVTGCLDPGVQSRRFVDGTSFREWAISTPGHPLAIRYQPLFAWLLAGRCDPRFLSLVDQFVHRERIRLRFEIVAAAERLSKSGGVIHRQA